MEFELSGGSSAVVSGNVVVSTTDTVATVNSMFELTAGSAEYSEEYRHFYCSDAKVKLLKSISSNDYFRF